MGARSDCTSYPASGCVPIQWPGERTTARHELEPQGEIRNWFGSLVDDMRDATGQMYKRNRYYDPQTGQFTQPDPIGIAGGLNEYGFSEGDPVSYADPYGLKVCLAGSTAEIGAMKTALEGATGATVSLDKKNCVSEVGASSDRRLRGLRDRLHFLSRRGNTYTVGFTGSAEFNGSRCLNLGSHFCPDDLVVELDPGDVHRRTDPAAYFGCSLIGAAEIGPMVGHSGETIISHELLGHAWANEAGLDIWSERTAIRAENVFRGRGGGRKRCGG